MRVLQETADRWGAVASEKFLPDYCPSRCWPPLLTSRGCRVRTFSLPSPFGFSGSDGAHARHATLSAIVRFSSRDSGTALRWGPLSAAGTRSMGKRWSAVFTRSDQGSARSARSPGGARGAMRHACRSSARRDRDSESCWGPRHLGSLCDRLRLRLRPLRVLSAFAVRCSDARSIAVTVGR